MYFGLSLRLEGRGARRVPELHLLRWGGRLLHHHRGNCRHVTFWTYRHVHVFVGHRRVVQGRVHGHRDPDLATEGHGERVLELSAQPALELAAGEVVGDGDDRGALVEGDRLARPQPRPLVGLQVVDDAAPGSVQVSRRVLHGSRLLDRYGAGPVPGLGPQLCPQVVNPPSALWREPGRDASQRPAEHCCACSEPLFRSLWCGSQGAVERAGPGVAGNLGAPNVTSRGRFRQEFIHRARPRARDRGLTLLRPSAYRWPVTWCRPVPHVHGGSVCTVGGRCQPKGALLIPPVWTVL